jgi:desulfoferrodoxin (superoxide reductase-like protein)
MLLTPKNKIFYTIKCASLHSQVCSCNTYDCFDFLFPLHEYMNTWIHVCGWNIQIWTLVWLLFHPNDNYFFIQIITIISSNEWLLFHPMNDYYFIQWMTTISSNEWLLFHPMNDYFFIQWMTTISSNEWLLFHPMNDYYFIQWMTIFFIQCRQGNTKNHWQVLKCTNELGCNTLAIKKLFSRKLKPSLNSFLQKCLECWLYPGWPDAIVKKSPKM